MISAAPVMPLWKKVESPMTPNTFLSVWPVAAKALAMPMATVKPPPMHTTLSRALRGAEPPRV